MIIQSQVVCVGLASTWGKPAGVVSSITLVELRILSTKLSTNKVKTVKIMSNSELHPHRKYSKFSGLYSGSIFKPKT